MGSEERGPPKSTEALPPLLSKHTRNRYSRWKPQWGPHHVFCFVSTLGYLPWWGWVLGVLREFEKVIVGALSPPPLSSILGFVLNKLLLFGALWTLEMKNYHQWWLSSWFSLKWRWVLFAAQIKVVQSFQNMHTNLLCYEMGLVCCPPLKGRVERARPLSVSPLRKEALTSGFKTLSFNFTHKQHYRTFCCFASYLVCVSWWWFVLMEFFDDSYL